MLIFIHSNIFITFISYVYHYRCTSDEDMVIVNFENAVLVSHTDLFYDRLLKVYRMIGTLDLLWTRGLSALKMKQEARIVKQNVKVDRTYQDDYLHGDIDTDKKKKKKKHPKGVRWSDSNSDNLRSSPSDVRDISDVISPKLKNGKISSDYTSDGKKRKWLAPVGSASMQHSSNHSSLSHTAGLLHTKTMSK